MSSIWIDVDAAVEVPVNLLPLTDDTDFKTRETSVAYNAAGMDLVWNFVTPDGAITQTAVTPTTGGDYDWAHIGDGMYKIEIPASGGASINNVTEGFGYFTGMATGVLPWRGPTIGFRAAGLNDKMIESAYSATRGLAGTALPNAAADAAGGLPISDTGGLNLDAKLANTNEVTAARMGVLTDWINGGRLDLLLDSVKAVTDALPNSGALTDLATAAALATVDGNVDSILTDTGELQADLTDGGRLDLLIDAIKAKTDNLPASPAAVGSLMGLADGAITAAKIASNAITAVKIADDAITSAKLAADSIGSSQLATSAVTEIQTNLATAAKLLAYVQLLARKDAAIATDNSTELGEINADGGSGAGGFDNTTDAVEAVRDRGDSDWVTATGFSTLDAAGIRTAVGLASANLDTQLAATKTVADAILVDTAEIGAAGAGLSGIPWNASWDAEVQSECTDALNAYDPPTRAELASDINSVLAKSLAYTQLIVRSDAAIATDNATELTAINADGGSGAGGFSNQTDSVQAIRDRGDTAWTTGAGGSAPSAASIADAVWDEARADHTTAGTFGEHTGDAAMRGTNNAALASVATEARLAELDAANLPADVDSLLTRIPAALFSGITSLAGWLRLSLRSDAAATTDESTSLSEINADGGSGAGDYAATTDSQEATRDRGDAAWVTGVGGSSSVIGGPSKSGGKQ